MSSLKKFTQVWAQFGHNQDKNQEIKGNMKGLQVLDFIWCLGPDLNRHDRGLSRDFKSLASTNSATQAFIVHYLISC
jgi:hypothetical protein